MTDQALTPHSLTSEEKKKERGALGLQFEWENIFNHPPQRTYLRIILKLLLPLPPSPTEIRHKNARSETKKKDGERNPFFFSAGKLH